MLRMEYVATYPRPQTDNSATPAAAGLGSVEMDSSAPVRCQCSTKISSLMPVHTAIYDCELFLLVMGCTGAGVVVAVP